MSAEAIQFRRYGQNGPLVVVLHGGPGAPGEMAPLAERLSTAFNVIEPLQRSSGAVPLTVATHVTDLHQVIEKSRGNEAVRLVGFSWGAMLALTYAARHPAGVERVVAIGCGTFDKQARQVFQARMTERMDETIRRRMNEIGTTLGTEADPMRRDSLLAELGRICTRLQAFDPVDADSSESVRCDERAFRETWADALRLQEDGTQPAEFRHITAPVTMVHGAADPHPGRLIYESLQPFIRRLAYVEIPQCGHKPWIERHAAEAFRAALIRCLA